MVEEKFINLIKQLVKWFNMLTEKQISNLIYYGSAILAMIPLTVLYALTGEQLWAYALVGLISGLFGLKLTLNDIPHWIIELKNIHPLTEPVSKEEPEDFFTALEKRVQKVDKQLKEQVEKDQQVVPEGIVIEERKPEDKDFAFLGISKPKE